MNHITKQKKIYRQQTKEAENQDLWTEKNQRGNAPQVLKKMEKKIEGGMAL